MDAVGMALAVVDGGQIGQSALRGLLGSGIDNVMELVPRALGGIGTIGIVERQHVGFITHGVSLGKLVHGTLHAHIGLVKEAIHHSLVNILSHLATLFGGAGQF